MATLRDLTGAGDNLVVRQGDRITPAPPEDQAVAASYETFPDKGAVVEGYRLTLLAKKLAYAIDEVARFVHICEATTAAGSLYIMGPKPVWGEYVDDRLATDAPPNPSDPLTPPSYDGRVLSGPGIDANYEITEHRFDTAGRHSVQWRLDPYVSNVLWLEVSETAP